MMLGMEVGRVGIPAEERNGDGACWQKLELSFAEGADEWSEDEGSVEDEEADGAFDFWVGVEHDVRADRGRAGGSRCTP